MRGWAGVFPHHGIGPDRARNVFEVLLAQISEVRSDLAPDMVVNRRRDADAAGSCDALKARCNIHSLPKDITGLDDYVADVHTHTESNTPVFRITSCKFTNARLKLDCRSHRLDRARKLRQEPVPSVLHYAAAVLGD